MTGECLYCYTVQRILKKSRIQEIGANEKTWVDSQEEEGTASLVREAPKFGALQQFDPPVTEHTCRAEGRMGMKERNAKTQLQSAAKGTEAYWK